MTVIMSHTTPVRHSNSKKHAPGWRAEIHAGHHARASALTSGEADRLRNPPGRTMHQNGRAQRQSARSRGAPSGRARRASRLAALALLLLSWPFQPVAPQVPSECGAPEDGAIADSPDACKGFYVGSDAGFATTCGDGYARSGGCEVNMSLAFGRHDADGDGKINAQEAIGLLRAVGIGEDALGKKFETVDADADGKMTLAEWEGDGDVHPGIAVRIKGSGGFDKTFAAESAEFGPAFRDTLGTAYSFPLKIADPIQACTSFSNWVLNGDDYQDKTVLIARGTCEFCHKARIAQDKGAKAVMIYQSVGEGLIHMLDPSNHCGPGTAHAVTIPSIMIPHAAGVELAQLSETAEVFFPTCLDGGTVMAGYGIETCDDGNTDAGDGCNSQCILECGNNVIDGQETCDDGNRNSTDGCSDNCRLESGYTACSRAGCSSQCGDGVVVGKLNGCELSAKEGFDRNDLDGDGELTREEAASLFQAGNSEHGPIDIDTHFDKFDQNSNGKVSLEEWESGHPDGAQYENIHPPLAVRIVKFNGAIETHKMETAAVGFGPDIRHPTGSDPAFYSGLITVADPLDACASLTGQYTGRIVLAGRGTCEFCVKAKHAQEKGAIAILIANHGETLTHMAPGTCGADVTIPTVMVQHSVAEELQDEKYTESTVIFPVCPTPTHMLPGQGLEQCDDGNTVSGDGCSKFCMCEQGKDQCPVKTTSTTLIPTTTSTTPEPTTSTTSLHTTSTTPTPTTTSTTPEPTTSTTSLHTTSTTAIAVTVGTTPHPTTNAAGQTSSTTLLATTPAHNTTSVAWASSTSMPATTPSPAGAVVEMKFTLPYTKAAFTEQKQLTFRTAISATVNVLVEYVKILSITEIQDRRTGGLSITTQVLAADKAAGDQIASSFNIATLNQQLNSSGISSATLVSPPSVSVIALGTSSLATTTVAIVSTPKPADKGVSFRELIEEYLWIVIVVGAVLGTIMCSLLGYCVVSLLYVPSRKAHQKQPVLPRVEVRARDQAREVGRSLSLPKTYGNATHGNGILVGTKGDDMSRPKWEPRKHGVRQDANGAVQTDSDNVVLEVKSSRLHPAISAALSPLWDGQSFLDAKENQLEFTTSATRPLFAANASPAEFRQLLPSPPHATPPDSGALATKTSPVQPLIQELESKIEVDILPQMHRHLKLSVKAKVEQATLDVQEDLMQEVVTECVMVIAMLHARLVRITPDDMPLTSHCAHRIFCLVDVECWSLLKRESRWPYLSCVKSY